MAARNTLPLYSDIDINFNPHPITGDVLRVTGAQSVVQSVLNLVQINHYEVPFHPEIGGNVRKLLFELADPITANLLAEEIRNVIRNFEPRAKVIDVLVESDVDQNGFNVTITFFVLSTTQPLTISFFLTRLR